jgi:RHS repeat-associated protein
LGSGRLCLVGSATWEAGRKLPNPFQLNYLRFRYGGTVFCRIRIRRPAVLLSPGFLPGAHPDGERDSRGRTGNASSFQPTSLSYLRLVETRTYNSLLQLSRIQNSNFDEEYLYRAGQNNGRIVQSIDHILNETVNYSYDALNRLTSAEEASGKWGNAFSYDGWGNMNGQTWTPGYVATPGTMIPVGPHSGDANGNNTPGGYVFDVENRIVQATLQLYVTTTYGYDPWGKRVSICCTKDQYNNPVKQIVFYGIAGRKLATYQLNGSSLTLQGTTVYFGGTLIQANGVAVATDRLGSVRSNGNGEKFAYYPYGQERTSTADGREKFGTYFRDGTGVGGFGHDYADQRYYDANSGSFWSTDPGGAATANPKNPTSWNRYVYANGDPVNFRDPTAKSVLTAIGGAIWGFLTGSDDEPLPDESDGPDDDDPYPCGGDYFNPAPNPGCYAPVPPPPPKPAPLPIECEAALYYRPVNDWRASLVGATHSFWWWKNTIPIPGPQCSTTPSQVGHIPRRTRSRAHQRHTLTSGCTLQLGAPTHQGTRPYHSAAGFPLRTVMG